MIRDVEVVVVVVVSGMMKGRKGHAERTQPHPLSIIGGSCSGGGGDGSANEVPEAAQLPVNACHGHAAESGGLALLNQWSVNGKGKG